MTSSCSRGDAAAGILRRTRASCRAITMRRSAGGGEDVSARAGGCPRRDKKRSDGAARIRGASPRSEKRRTTNRATNPHVPRYSTRRNNGCEHPTGRGGPETGADHPLPRRAENNKQKRPAVGRRAPRTGRRRHSDINSQTTGPHTHPPCSQPRRHTPCSRNTETRHSSLLPAISRVRPQHPRRASCNPDSSSKLETDLLYQQWLTLPHCFPFPFSFPSRSDKIN